MDVGTIGGIIGGIIGLTGGAVGTYASIKNTGGLGERQFMVRVAIVACLTFLFVLPSPYR